MALEIDRKLNLVIPLRREDQVLYVHSMPINKATFRHFFRVMSKAFAQMYKDNLQILGGPRVMGMMLEDVARATPRDHDLSRDWWEGDDGVERGLLTEIRRLSNVLLYSDGEWKSVPYQDALKGLLQPEEIEEVEGAITFFTVNSLMLPRLTRNSMLEGATSMYGLLTTSYTPMEYMSSLKTLTTDEPIGEKEEPFSIPH